MSEFPDALPDEYEHEHWADTDLFLDHLDDELSKLEFPPEITMIKAVRYLYLKLESANSELEFIVKFSNGGRRRFIVVTYEALKKGEQFLWNSELDRIYVQGCPTCIVSRITPLAVFNSIIKYILFEQDRLDDAEKLALQMRFNSDFTTLPHYHSLDSLRQPPHT